ncbi:hypothetical protein acdb102_01500 [Acidothermaceae bacterium B102]|nr:hypothetical protein acdb102_01500 [Acidothermaceae bacterium B102]
MLWLNRNDRHTDHSQAGLATSECTNIATSTAMTAADTHRPGWRTGIATSSSAGRVLVASRVSDVLTGSTGRD